MEEKIKAIIIDDEQESIEALRIKLDICEIPVDVIFTFNEANNIQKLLSNLDFDILFLDVEMPGINGIDLLERLADRDYDVIITTAYNQYAIRAIKAEVTDYLLKPIAIDELNQTLKKVLDHKKMRENYLEKSEHLASSQTHEISRLALNSLSEIHYVKTDDIIYLLGENNYSSFILTNGQRIIVTKTLKEYENILPSHSFFRVHKSSIINIKHIKKMNKRADFYLEMSNGDVVNVSYRKKADFLKFMQGRVM